MSTFVASVYELCQRNYERGGDVVVECFSEEEVLKHFSIYPLVFKFILMKITGTFNLVKNSFDLLRIYHHMKNNQDRYGMEVKIAELMKVSTL